MGNSVYKHLKGIGDSRDRPIYRIRSNHKADSLNQKVQRKTLQHMVLTQLLPYQGKHKTRFHSTPFQITGPEAINFSPKTETAKDAP